MTPNMSDHERSPARTRNSLGAGNPHPGNDTPKPNEPARRLHVFDKADLEAIRAAWLELHDIGLVALRFPKCWRGAIAVTLRLMAAETECGVCPFACHEPGNPECFRLSGKLPKLPNDDLSLDKG